MEWRNCLQPLGEEDMAAAAAAAEVTYLFTRTLGPLFPLVGWLGRGWRLGLDYSYCIHILGTLRKVG